MSRALCVLPLLLVASPSLANTVGCGANSLSYGEVDAGPPPQARRGVIEILPDSLCADLVERRAREIESLSIVIDPRSGQVEAPERGSAVPGRAPWRR